MNDKLTAYALNELPPEERAALEAQMQGDPQLRQEAEAMKTFCGLLQHHVGNQEDEELTGEQRSEVLKAFLSTSRKVSRPPFWRRTEFLSTAIAAGLALALLVPSGVLLERREMRHESQASPFAEEAVLERSAAEKENTVVVGSVIVESKRSESGPDEIELEIAQGNKPIVPAPAPAQAPIPGEKPATLGKAQSRTPSVTAPPAPVTALPKSEVPMKAKGPPILDETSASGMRARPMESANAPAAAPADGFAASAPPMEIVVSDLAAAPRVAKKDAAAAQAPASNPAPRDRFADVAERELMTPQLQVAPAPATDSDRDSLKRSTAMPPKSLGVFGGGLLPEPLPSSSPGAGRQFGLGVQSGDQRRDTPYLLAPDAFVIVPDPSPAQSQTAATGETYAPVSENPFQETKRVPLSTFSMDVDTASYANVRRFLNHGQRPPRDAVRLEELVNYFPYAYDGPAGDAPFAVHVDLAEAPWKPEHRLARIAVKGRVHPGKRLPANFVFLVDVSGSMNEPDKLPLVKKSLLLLTEQLQPEDRVSLVTYAGRSALALEPTSGEDKSRIAAAVQNLEAGGSTNGAGGIQLAYEQAAKHFLKEGINRVILCTDGDFNVGMSSPEALQKFITEKARTRVFLSVLGYGTGNLKDRTMETLADKGDGNYAYIDSLSEARKVLVEQMNATLITIAKDVKIQVEFNPAQVQAYRLIGYENRLLAKEDFNNDRKDAGEIGEGHTVTALYEVVPVNVKLPDGRPLVDALRYATVPQPEPAPVAAAAAAAGAPAAEAATAPASTEVMTVKLRYKMPDGDTSTLMELPVSDSGAKLAETAPDFQFAAAVAGFGMLLRESPHAEELSWERVRQLALAGKGPDELGYRGEFLRLIDKAMGIMK